MSCTELTAVPITEQEDLDQRIVDNYCDGEIHLEDSIEKLRKLLEQRQRDKENLNFLRYTFHYSQKYLNRIHYKK